MHMLRHHHITQEMKPHLLAHPPQLFHKDVPRPRRLQQRQSPIAAERNKVQIALAIVALQSRRHRKSHEKNVHPKTQVQKPNLGHPPPLYTSTRRTAVIFSPLSLCPQQPFFQSRATRPSPTKRTSTPRPRFKNRTWGTLRLSI